MISTGDVNGLIGAMLLDRDDTRIGEIRRVVLDDDGDEPVWVGVRAESLDAEVLVPLEGADWEDDALRASVTGSSARTARPVDPEAAPTQQEQDQLFRHYGIPHVCTQRADFNTATWNDESISYSSAAR